MDRSETVYEWDGPPVVRLERCGVTLPSGLSFQQHTLSTGGSNAGVVMIAELGEKVLFVESYRPAVGETLVELPRGMMDDSDTNDPLNAAARELSEETGYLLVNACVVGEYITDSGIYPSRVTVTSGTAVPPQGSAVTDGEVQSVRWIATSEMSGLLGTTFRDAHTLAALNLWQARRGA